MKLATIFQHDVKRRDNGPASVVIPEQYYAM